VPPDEMRPRQGAPEFLLVEGAAGAQSFRTSLRKFLQSLYTGSLRGRYLTKRGNHG
jgi:hypothetical protein